MQIKLKSLQPLISIAASSLLLELTRKSGTEKFFAERAVAEVKNAFITILHHSHRSMNIDIAIYLYDKVRIVTSFIADRLLIPLFQEMNNIANLFWQRTSQNTGQFDIFKVVVERSRDSSNDG